MFGGNKCALCKGTGLCRECYGTGKNTHFNIPGDLCEACKGTAKCQSCGGREPRNPITKFFQRLSGER
jgi:hypothetical protein